MQVAGHFEANDDGSTAFVVAVSDFNTVRPPHSEPTSVVLYFCGPVRHGLKITEVNDGGLDVNPLPEAALVYDSVLGDRSECDYTVAEFSNGFQTIVEGTSSYRMRAVSAANVTYTAPAIVSILLPEGLLEDTANPLGPGSEINAAFTNLPSDLSVTSSTPSIPASGHPVWSHGVDGEILPDLYRLTGERASIRNMGQAQFYAASAFSGISGAALLWLIQIGLSSVLEKRAAQ